MGLMEPGCNLEDFGRLVQPAATNRLRCRVNVVSERYLTETHIAQNGVKSRCICLACVWLTVCLCSIYQLMFYGLKEEIIALTLGLLGDLDGGCVLGSVALAVMGWL